MTSCHPASLSQKRRLPESNWWKVPERLVQPCGSRSASSARTHFVTRPALLGLASVAVSAADLSPIEGGPVRAILLIAALVALTFCVLPAGASHRVPPSQLQLQRIIRHAFPDDQGRALCIADFESDGDPHHWTAAAVNGPHVGLFQISYRWHRHAGESWSVFLRRESNPWLNAAHARRIYLDAKRRWGNGWIPWSTRGLCSA